MEGWVATWGCALQPPDQPDDPDLAQATLRQTIRVTTGGSAGRLTLSNEYGAEPLELDGVTVARPVAGRAGVPDIQPDTAVAVTFGGSRSVTIPPGSRLVSDEFTYIVEPRTNLTVTLHIGSAPAMLTTHPGSRTTSHVLPRQEGRPPRQIPSRGRPSNATPGAGTTAVTHWYFLAALDVRSAGPGAAVVCLGDSLTDGRGSTTDGNDRWPDVLADRLHAAGRTHVAVVNQAAGGSRVLRDGLGIAAVRRLDRDVAGTAGVRWLVVFAGINDIGMADATVRAQQRIEDDLIAGYAKIIDWAHAHGITVYGVTLTPFGGHEYDDPRGRREQTRRRVNAWIRTSRQFDAVIDFDQIVRDPDDHARVRPALHDGDGLHLNPLGYRALADAVPLDLFAG
ncbi:MAG: SGNH/GDSL hydrolase family protein [Micromonosporaceae bacterium]|nr:SGNH/GDSL hydrolase family protein [Micromonosporaceae bacterium]